ncbi:MAG: hypothetical protein ACLPX7_05660 [Xanthobacteraceae bacterium]
MAEPLAGAGAAFSAVLTVIAVATGCAGLAAACDWVGAAGVAVAAALSVASLSLLSSALPSFEDVLITDAGTPGCCTAGGLPFAGAVVSALFAVAAVPAVWSFAPLAAFAFGGTLGAA